MRHRSALPTAAALVAAALTLTACGSRDSGNAGSSANGSGPGQGGSTVVIGFDGPLTGDLSALALGARNAAELAVRQANEKNLVPGVTFKLEALDDLAQPSNGQQNATKFVADDRVLGVVGPLNSSVAQSMQKVFDQAKLAAVSPSTTNPALTQGENWASGDKKRPFASYFRTATTDDVQGPFAAQYMKNDLAKGKVFVVDNKKAYGAGLASTFKAEFTRIGGQVVGEDHINSGEKDFSAVVTKIRTSGAEAVYFGGEYADSGLFTDQLKKSGAQIPLMGGDGMNDAKYIQLANGNGEGDYATSVGAPVEALPSAKDFVAAYGQGGFKEPYGGYGGYSYDAVSALIQAVKATVEGNGGKLPGDARAKVLAALQKVAFDGVTGRVSFDEFGDTTNKQLTVYQVKGGQWAPVKSGELTVGNAGASAGAPAQGGTPQ
ncbi:branched-chain amino acid ABC transporter substrate-binding protein [Streptodolium elevatio]|uniref:Branched-chain amino acid ABC transporter substrate-binding protein n=1 Tax=Streptodolium elevatio TaxID=3157996 RepID=A0ABV3DQ93_9ACTN